MTLSSCPQDALIRATCAQPHDVLGLRVVTEKGKPQLFARAYLRDAKSCEVVDVETDKRYPLTQVHESGLYEGVIPRRKDYFRYRLRTESYNGEVRQFWDPYTFLPTLSEQDIYLFCEGRLHNAYDKLGAHLREVDGVKGVGFAVWAPHAQRISVVGDFCDWDGRYFPMRRLGASGVWELFIPGLAVGEHYKYELLDANDAIQLKADPYATYYEAPPGNTSIVWDASGYRWNDKEWLEKRAATDWKSEPVSIYEVHLGSWRWKVDGGSRPLSYREVAPMLADYCHKMGFTHVEFLPLSEFPFPGSWGYQVTGFFAPTHRYGTPQDFKFLVDHLHQQGIGVIMDWVPAHFPRDAFALAKFDGTALYEHADPRLGEHLEWGTLIFNYGRHEVRNFLISSALAWFERFHIDGLRVDAVASMLYLDYAREDGEWLPNRFGGRENIEAIEFLRETNSLVHHYYKGALMIAEESTSFGGVTAPVQDGGLGFDYKWNMGWMHDSLRYFKQDPLFRKGHHNGLTFAMLYQYDSRFMTVFSHDEVVHGKSSMLMKMGAGGTVPAKAADLRCLYAWMWMWPGKKCLFMGSEFGQSAEWRYDASLDWHLLQYVDHLGLQRLVEELNHLYKEQPALSVYEDEPRGFAWINAEDADNSVYSFLRFGESETETLAVVGNFTPVTREYRIGVPHAGKWRLILNTQNEFFGGNASGLHTNHEVQTEAVAWNNHAQSLSFQLTGHSVYALRYAG